MPETPIWILEDDPRRAERMLHLCARWNVAVCVFRTASMMLDAFERESTFPSVISLDHDLNLSVAADDDQCGMCVVEWLVQHDPFAHVIVHSSNDPCARKMVISLDDVGWPVQRCVPADDLGWIDDQWIERIDDAVRQSVLGEDLLLTWDDDLRDAIRGDALLLGIIGVDRSIRVFWSSPVTDASHGRFRCHEDVVRYLEIDRATILGGFSVVVRNGVLNGLSGLSAMNDPASRYLLPQTLINAIIRELGLPRSDRFRRYA